FSIFGSGSGDKIRHIYKNTSRGRRNPPRKKTIWHWFRFFTINWEPEGSLNAQPGW
uniref:Uncharacterized protein n=1 Tax=Poecilia latipinna TaxID=48699 RepID=A0A3B3V9G6_9TELE